MPFILSYKNHPKIAYFPDFTNVMISVFLENFRYFLYKKSMLKFSPKRLNGE